MNRIFDITLKDLMQILRNRMTFLFLLIMPVAFTLLFGLAFAGSSQPSDTRLPVGLLNQDGGAISTQLQTLLSGSTVIRLDTTSGRSLSKSPFRRVSGNKCMVAGLGMSHVRGIGIKAGAGGGEWRAGQGIVGQETSGVGGRGQREFSRPTTRFGRFSWQSDDERCDREDAQIAHALKEILVLRQ